MYEVDYSVIYCQMANKLFGNGFITRFIYCEALKLKLILNSFDSSFFLASLFLVLGLRYYYLNYLQNQQLIFF